ncbi:MAG: TonB-dependent receptor [Methylophaga sp.]
MSHPRKSLCLAISLALSGLSMHVFAETESTDADAETLESLTVTASADASAEGLSPAFEGGQVAEGGRAGILGTKDHLETPFSITSYTNEFIQDRQAQSVGDVLQADPGVRVARGFGNFQETYFIRGFILGSDDIAYNGLYSLLPRQYIATELFERVEVLRGASAFLTGATPSGGGIGGTINLLPKRAPNYPLTRLTVGTEHFEQGHVALDVGRRFGEQEQFGIRVNAAHRDGGTSIEDESASLNLFSVGLDYRGEKLRLSADLGSQDNELEETRTNVTLQEDVTKVPNAPDSEHNWAQPWTYSDEDDIFGTFRAEYDFNDNVTGWAAYGMRRSNEANSLANLRVDSNNGDGDFFRFDNTREDRVDTGEIGLRGIFNTGSIGHEWVIAYSYFQQETKNAFFFDFDTFATNLYNPTYYSQPQPNGVELVANSLKPRLNAVTKLNSFAIGDTLSMFEDSLLLTLGVRHQTLGVKDLGYDYNNFTGSEYKERELTPALGLVYKLTDRFSVYANYVENLEAGGQAPTTEGYVNSGEALDPFVSEQQEVGLKYETESMGYGLAYFTTDRPREGVDENNVYGVNGEDEHQGVELTFYGKTTDNIKLLGGVTWLDAEQKDTGNSALDGNDVIGVAEYQANIGAELEVPQIDGLALDTRLIYTGSRYADAANTLKVDDWTTIDIGARYIVAMGNQDLTLRARVHNLFDRDYWSSVGGFPGNGYLVLGSPRTVSLTATIDFY